MASQSTEPELGGDSVEGRKQVQSSLESLRNALYRRQLALFVGEEISSLPATHQDWWTFVGEDVKEASRIVGTREKEFLNSLQPPGQSNIHNTLRTVGEWPIIFTTNMDRLLEQLVWGGEDIEKMRLDQIPSLDIEEWLTCHSSRRLIIKAYGDNGVVTKLNPISKHILTRMTDDICQSLKSIFDRHSVLFLGLDMDKYNDFFERVVFPSKVQHYMLAQGLITDVRNKGSLQILIADLELWEFSRYLTSGRIDEVIIPGKACERSYLASQREEYLQQQLQLEQQAAEILFHTLQITNALATDEILEKQCRPKLADIYRKDPLGIYSEDNVEKAYQAMIARRNNLVKVINTGAAPVKAIFFYEEFLKEVEEKIGESVAQKGQRKMAVLKYADAILLAKSVLRPNSTLELLVVEGLSPDQMIAMQKETYALIKLKERRDEAVCYAETAVPGKKLLQTHFISLNGAEVASKRRVFESSLAKAWPNKESILKLTAKLMEVDKNLNALPPTLRERLQSLNSVVAMLDRSIDATSLVHLGGGSFGDVYRANWNNIPVALKFLKDAVHSDDIYKFQLEFDSLLRAKHDNIVRVYKMTVEDNRLGLIMEYVDGHNLRQLLVDRGPQEPDTVNKCALQMASAIKHLHSMKIVHRDIKTDNILVTKDLQTFKLADFGLARVVEKTEQYKTVKGTYRYMAPEILRRSKDGSGAKYSLTVDVYSYGLVLLETITGKPVFQNLDRHELELGKRQGTLTPTIPDWCAQVHGEIIVRIIQLAVLDADKRPKMEKIHDMLINKHALSDAALLEDELDNSSSTDLGIICLGTGKGATTLLTGEPSSSFVITHKGKPLLIVDMGFGVVQSYRKYVGKDSCIDRVYVTHNHADHAAELPVILAVVCGKQSVPVVFAAPEVVHRLKTQRFGEITSTMNLEEFVDLRTCQLGKERTPIDDEGKFSVSVIPSQHTETCFGFILYENGVPVLGYTGDSGFKRSLYDQLFAAPNVIIDARHNSSYEHAGFSEVSNYLENKKLSKHQVFITGYGTESEYPDDGVANATQMITGERYSVIRANQNDVTDTTLSYESSWQRPLRTNITAEYLVPPSHA